MRQLRHWGLLAAVLLAGFGSAAARAEGRDEAARPESRIRVLLPTADARLEVDGQATRARGLDRVFRSVDLEEGSRYAYTLTATWTENGRSVSHDMKVVFRAGEDVVVSFRR